MTSQVMNFSASTEHSGPVFRRCRILSFEKLANCLILLFPHQIISNNFPFINNLPVTSHDFRTDSKLTVRLLSLWLELISNWTVSRLSRGCSVYYSSPVFLDWFSLLYYYLIISLWQHCHYFQLDDTVWFWCRCHFVFGPLRQIRRINYKLTNV